MYFTVILYKIHVTLDYLIINTLGPKMMDLTPAHSPVDPGSNAVVLILIFYYSLWPLPCYGGHVKPLYPRFSNRRGHCT